MMRIVAGLLVILAAGCSQIQTASEIDSGIDFSTYKTFAWLTDIDKTADDVRLNDPEVRKTIRTAVEQSLSAKGYQQADRSQADFLVAWFGAIEQKIKKENIDHFYAPYGYGTLYRDPALNPESPRALMEYETGTLIIDIADPEDRRIIWRGSGSGRIVEDRTKQAALDNLSRSVTKILEPFPSR